MNHLGSEFSCRCKKCTAMRHIQKICALLVLRMSRVAGKRLATTEQKSIRGPHDGEARRDMIEGRRVPGRLTAHGGPAGAGTFAGQAADAKGCAFHSVSGTGVPPRPGRRFRLIPLSRRPADHASSSLSFLPAVRAARALCAKAGFAALALALLPGTVAAQGTLPTVSVSDAGYEEGGWMTFVVSLSEPSDENVTVDFQTSSGTATSGTDFSARSGTLTFYAAWRSPYLDRRTREEVNVSVRDDWEIEPDETFTLTLSNPKGATLGDAVATGTITDTTVTLKASGHRGDGGDADHRRPHRRLVVQGERTPVHGGPRPHDGS